MEPSQSSPASADPAVPGLAVVIVNYRSWPDVAALVAALIRSEAVRASAAEVVVVDNASGQAVPPALAATPGVRLLLLGSNDGFSAGVNAGWRATASPWLLVLNPDIVPDADFLDRIASRIAGLAARPGPAPGVVGFALRNPDGTPQPSVGIFPSLARTVREQVIPRTRRQYQPDRRVRPGPVDWVTGACMLVAAPLLIELGGMDDDFFLYYEEVALCRAAHERGWAVEYDPSVAVTHLRPLQNRAISSRMRLITRHSKLLYFRKHLPGWQFAALRWVVRVEAGVRGAWCRLRGGPGARTWRAVGEVARRAGSGGNLRGRAVRDLADAVARAEDDPNPDDDGGGPRAARPHRPRPRRPVRRADRGERLGLR